MHLSALANIPALRVLRLTDQKRTFVHTTGMAFIWPVRNFQHVESGGLALRKMSFQSEYSDYRYASWTRPVPGVTQQ